MEIKELDPHIHRDIIRDLRQAAFRDTWLDQEYEWKYLLPPQGRMKVFGAYDTAVKQYVGVFSCMLREFWTQGGIVRLVQQADAAVHPQHQRKGVFTQLVNAVSTYTREVGAPFHFGFTNDLSGAAMRKFENSREDYSDRVYVRPLGPENFWKQVIGRGNRLERLLSFTTRPIFRGLNAFRYRGFEPLEVIEVESFDNYCDDLAKLWSSRYSLVPRRTSAFMKWRVLDAPAHHGRRIKAYWVRSGGRRVGYAVVYHETERNLLKLVDILCDPGQTSIAAIVQTLMKKAIKIGVDGVATNMAGAKHHEAFSEAGLFGSKRVRTTLIFTSPSNASPADPEIGWYLAPIDRDTRGGY